MNQYLDILLMFAKVFVVGGAIVDFAGAGATVPICGFGYLLARGAIQGAKIGLFNAFTGALTAASAGISAAVIFAFIAGLIFRSKTKKN